MSLYWFPAGRLLNAEVAQLVERNLAKVEVAGSNPVFRSKGDVAEWLATALQKLVHRFDSGRRLGWGNTGA